MKPTINIITFLLLLSVASMFIFPNTMYYALNLLLIVFLTLSFIFFSGLVSSLTVLMLLIVYVGAMIILVGYVCAVCPNLNFSPSNRFLFLLPLFLFSFFLLPPFYFVSSHVFVTNLSFLFAPSGSLVFIVLVFILFVILLVVTSYYVSPNGPFRSVS